MSGGNPERSVSPGSDEKTLTLELFNLEQIPEKGYVVGRQISSDQLRHDGQVWTHINERLAATMFSKEILWVKRADHSQLYLKCLTGNNTVLINNQDLQADHIITISPLENAFTRIQIVAYVPADQSGTGC